MTPGLKHNTDLTEKLVAELKVMSRYPKVTDQLPCLAIEPGRLVKHGYNPSIIQEDDHLLMAYRYHDGNTLSTKLALAQIGFDGKVLSNRSIVTDPEFSAEDPKLFRNVNDIWMLWVESTWPKLPLKAIVRWSMMQDGKLVGQSFTAARDNPKSIEKNWIPFPTPGGVYFFYSLFPHQEICAAENGKLRISWTYRGLDWPWGTPRGGTVPLPFKGKLLRFFHAGADNEYGTFRRRYFVGAMLHEPEPPYAPVAISTSPVLYGSEIDDTPQEQWANCHHRKGQVVFPGGAVEHKGGWLLSVGVNDYSCAIVKVKPEDLHL